MLNLDNIVSNNNTSSLKDNDSPFTMLIIGSSGSGKINTSLHLINDYILLIKCIYMLKIYTNQSMNI